MQTPTRGKPDPAIATAWEHFEHAADVGVRGRGATPSAAFTGAALALAAVVADPARVQPVVAVPFSCSAPDLELLLVDWLNQLIYAMATRRLLFCRFAVDIDGERLQATAWGEPIDPARHRLSVEAKAATYTGLAVHRQADGGWVAQTVIDV
ncbi:MAG TPA: archease [Gammaproteobacteria bacterium]